MIDVRWDSPFPYTIAFNLFKQHITELNNAYWSFVPTANTIISLAKKELQAGNTDPKSFFLVHDEDDNRIAKTYEEWRLHFSEFQNYTRLNMVMQISSCFETYLRTIVSIAFESKPGSIIGCADAIDGAFLLKNDLKYGKSFEKNYRFAKYVDDVCRGTWDNRFAACKKYFGSLPSSILSRKNELDELRNTRNNIAHYFGREKKDYSAPLLFSPISAIRISHNRMLKYFKLVNEVSKQLDLHLKTHYVGSYDIIKLYFRYLSKGYFSDDRPGVKAQKFRKLLGNEKMPTVGQEYYSNLIKYCEQDSPASVCRYGMDACVKEINKNLKQAGITLKKDGRKTLFRQGHFKKFVSMHDWKTDERYCHKVVCENQTEYWYSAKVIEEILKEISSNSGLIVEELGITCIAENKSDI